MREQSGPWQVGCFQAHLGKSRANSPLKNCYFLQVSKDTTYNSGEVTMLLGMQVIEGYSLEHADCMVCDYVGGPLIIRNRRRPAHNQE